MGLDRARARVLGLAGFAMGGVALAASTAAAAPSPPASGQGAGSTLSREQVTPSRQLEQVRRQRPNDVFAGPARESCPLSGDAALSFKLQQIQLKDPTSVLSEQDRQAAFGEFVGKTITPAELCEIRDRLAARVFRRGVLARVVIPPQKISGGVVRLEVIAARIISVRFDGDSIGPVQAKAEGMLAHVRSRARFDLEWVQRWLILVNDLPGVSATARIAHSTAAGAPPEGLDLIVTLHRIAADQVGAISDTNAKTLGPNNGIVRLDFNSFTPWAEKTSLIAYTTLGNNRQEVVQVMESARIGDSGLFAQASFGWGHSRPGDVLKTLNLTGNSYTGTFEVDYPLVRLQRANVMLAAGMDIVNQDTSLPGNQPLVADKLRVMWARADASMIHVTPDFAGAELTTGADFSFQTRKGIDGLGSSKAGVQYLSRQEGRADAWVLRGEGHFSVRFAPLDGRIPPVALIDHYVGQWADRPLLGYEEQAIGNLTVGRGYDPAAASGDRVVANDLRMQVGPFTVKRRFGFTPYVFYDVAYVNNLDTGSQDVTVRSLGGGIEFRYVYDARGDAMRLDLGYAKPLDKPFASNPKKPPERFLFQLVVSH